MDAPTLWTCGHSNRTLKTFGELLLDAGIEVLCDVRSYPRSRRYPQFNRSTLDPALEEREIRYCWLGRELGGMRPRQEGSPHTGLAEDGRQGYADHMATERFRSGIEVLLELDRSSGGRVAVMCAERDWRSCHRSLLADYLVAVMEVRVRHLLEPGQIEPHDVATGARLAGDHLVYDRGGPPATPELF